MTKPFTVLIDLDSTTYDLLTPTLAWVKSTYDLNLAPSDIKVWGWDKEYKADLYSMWKQPGVFYSLKVFPHAKTAIKKVHEWGIRQIFFGALVDGPHVAWDKLRAVDRDFPYIGKRGVIFTGKDKDLIRGDMLIDDGPHNIESFESTGGATVLARMQPIEYNLDCKSDYIMTDWRQYPEIVLAEVKKRG